MPYLLSVDLGTTFSAAAVRDRDRIEIFQLGSRTATIPSVVALRDDGMMLVGEAADRRGITEPARVAREFKRRLGDPTPIIMGGTPYGAEALMAGLLRGIVDQVTERQEGPPETVVLSHPASYGPFKLDLMEQVGRRAELPDVGFISEPQAAALHYLGLERIELGDIVVVYDLGGGTFDAAMVRRTKDGFDLVGDSDGLDRFGGVDLDEAVFEHVRRSLGTAMEDLDPADPAVTSSLGRLREDCRSAKEALSSDTDTEIPVMLPGLHTEVRLTRTEFEDMIRPRLRETISLLERVVNSAGMEFQDVSRVLLVGGSSQIPLIDEMVREKTGRPIAHTSNPKHAMALGAAAATEAKTEPPTLRPDQPLDTASQQEREEGEPVASGGETASTRPAVDDDDVGDVEVKIAAAEPPEDANAPAEPETESSVLRRRIFIPGLAVLIVAIAATGAFLFAQSNDTDVNGADDAPTDEPIAELVVPVRIATTSDGAALTLISGATWSARGPIEVSGPNVDGAAEPEAILIGRLPEEPPGTWIEALFEVTFNDIEKTLTFSVERSDIDTQAEFSFPTNPNHPTFVAEGEINPIEFKVDREDLSG